MSSQERLLEARRQAVLKAQVSTSLSGGAVVVPAGEWFELIHAVDGALEDIPNEEA